MIPNQKPLYDWNTTYWADNDALVAATEFDEVPSNIKDAIEEENEDD